MPNALIFFLQIEDDYTNARLLREAFATYDPPYHCDIASRLSEAKALLEESPSKYSLIILDLGLDDSRNLRGLKELKSLYPIIPIGIVTGTHSMELAQEAYDEGAIFYIHKPFGHPHAAVRTMVSAFNMWQVQYAFCLKAWEAKRAEEIEDTKLPTTTQESNLPSPTWTTRRKALWGAIGTGALALVAKLIDLVVQWWEKKGK